MTWKPIETAPKDGSKILVSRFPYNGKYDPIKIVWWTNKNPGGWRWRMKRTIRYDPTHWTELPEPLHNESTPN